MHGEERLVEWQSGKERLVVWQSGEGHSRQGRMAVGQNGEARVGCHRFVGGRWRLADLYCGWWLKDSVMRGVSVGFSVVGARVVVG